MRASALPGAPLRSEKPGTRESDLTTPTAPHGPDSAEDVADLLELLAAANGRLRAELAALADSPAAVSQTTVGRLDALITQMRPAARVRAELAAIDHELLLAGAAVWVRRQGRPSAAARAAALWQVRS